MCVSRVKKVAEKKTRSIIIYHTMTSECRN